MSELDRNQRKNAPGNRSDIGWEHCREVDNDQKKVGCNYCEKIMSGGVNRLKHHLAGTRKDVAACESVPSEVLEQMKTIVQKPTKVSKGRKRSDTKCISEHIEEKAAEINDAKRAKKTEGNSLRVASPTNNIKGGITGQYSEQNLEDETRRQILRFLLENDISSRCVKSPEFIKMLQLVAKVGPTFNPPSYDDMTGRVIDEEVQVTLNSLKAHKDEWEKVNCSLIFCTQRNFDELKLDILVNSPKGTIFVSSRALSSMQEDDSKIIVDGVLQKLGRENIVQVIVNSNVSEHVTSVAERERLIITPCAAECLISIINDLIWKSDIIEISEFINLDTDLMSLFRDLTKGKKLISAPPERLSALGIIGYNILRNTSDWKGLMRKMIRSDQWKSSIFSTTEEGKDIEDLILSSKFWKDIFNLSKAIEPFIQLLEMLDSSEKPTMGFIYEEMRKAKENIQLKFKTTPHRLEVISKIIERRWDAETLRPIHKAAYYLNPQFQYTHHEFEAEIRGGLYECISTMVPQEEEKKKIHMQLEKFEFAKRLFAIGPAKSLLEDMAPADWWDSYLGDCPELQKFAKRIMSLTCSIPSSYVHYEDRMRGEVIFYPDRLGQLSFLSQNILLRNRFRGNGYLDADSCEIALDFHSARKLYDCVKNNDWLTNILESNDELEDGGDDQPCRNQHFNTSKDRQIHDNKGIDDAVVNCSSESGDVSNDECES